MSTSLMPIAILFRQMTARISFAANRSKAVKSLICILLFTLTMAILAVHLAHVAILYFYHQIPNWRLGVPPMLLNPVFHMCVRSCVAPHFAPQNARHLLHRGSVSKVESRGRYREHRFLRLKKPQLRSQFSTHPEHTGSRFTRSGPICKPEEFDPPILHQVTAVQQLIRLACSDK